MTDGSPIGFAGLYSDWTSPEGEAIRTCTIVTTEPNELLAPIHNRMPVILPQDVYTDWLKEGENDPVLLNSILRPYPSDEMEAYPVSRHVNSPQNDTPQCIIPIK